MKEGKGWKESTKLCFGEYYKFDFASGRNYGPILTKLIMQVGLG